MFNLKNITPILKWQIIFLFTLIISIGLYFLIGARPSLERYPVSIRNIPLLVAIVFCGIPLLFQIVSKLFKKDLGADLLAALAVLTAIYLTEYLAAALILLMLATGQILESFAVRKASSALLALSKRIPSIAHRKTKESIEDIGISSIQLEDCILIYPHETCPVDGVVIEGHGSMDESYLTGEPYYVSKAPGTSVLSGAINGESLLTIRAEKLPQDSRYAKIMKVMEDSTQKRPKIRRLSDQLGAIFAPFSLSYALAAWYLSDDPLRFLAVLVIATPCPLLIAIPITIVSAISLAARRGIIIKDPVVLEQLPRCTTAIFDKTGTLTYGRPSLEKIIAFSGYSEHQLLQYVASLERFSTHPLAKAIWGEAHKKRLSFLTVEHISENPGEGLTGSIQGHTIHITNRKFLGSAALTQSINLPSQSIGMESIILIDGQLAGLLQFHDEIRRDGSSFIRHLLPAHKLKKLIILSGDRLSEVEYLAKQLGITHVFANQTPEQKVEVVRKETALAPTLFMGDGINDAPALAAATVGLAFGAENIVTTEAAGAVFLESSLTKLDELIHISTSMRHVALVSAGGGMFLSVIGMYFAGIGMITPVAGALIQEGIDVIAILYALQLTWKSDPLGEKKFKK